MKISYKRGLKLIEKNNQKLVYKIKKNNKDNLYNYLRIKDFDNFLLPLEVTQEYEVYKYIDEKNIPAEDKAVELVNLLSLLHTKTTAFQEVNQEKVDEQYQTIKKEISYLKNYYLDLQDYIEIKEFMSPAEYHLMINISKFHKALNFAEKKLELWYQEKKQQIKERVVQLHNNITLDHFLIDDKPYFINWNKSKKDIVIYDFLNFYRNEYLNLEMSSLFEQYQAKYQYSNEELLLLQALIAIPDKITFKKSNLNNLIDTKKIINYIEKTNLFLSKYYKKNQSTNS